MDKITSTEFASQENLGWLLRQIELAQEAKQMSNGELANAVLASPDLPDRCEHLIIEMVFRLCPDMTGQTDFPRILNSK